MAEAGVPSMWFSYIIVDDIDAIAERAVQLGAQITMPVMDVMDSGRMLGITDPTGAAVYFWQPKRHHGAEAYGTPGSLIWNDLNTRDLSRAADFYEQLLGWQVDRSDQGDQPYWSFAVEGEPEGGMMRMGDQFPPDLPANWLVYFAVEDARGVTERAKELGGRAEMEPMEFPSGLFSVLSDPEGAVFAVMEMRH